MAEQDLLTGVYNWTFSLYEKGKLPPDLPAPYHDYLRAITERQEQNKAVLTVLTTLLVKNCILLRKTSGCTKPVCKVVSVEEVLTLA